MGKLAGDGHDMDHYAADLAALSAHLDLKNAVHVGHSTGGGEVAHYLGQHGESRVAKAVLICYLLALLARSWTGTRAADNSATSSIVVELCGNVVVTVGACAAARKSKVTALKSRICQIARGILGGI